MEDAGGAGLPDPMPKVHSFLCPPGPAYPLRHAWVRLLSARFKGLRRNRGGPRSQEEGSGQERREGARACRHQVWGTVTCEVGERVCACE